jgi:hypothetical protein
MGSASKRVASHVLYYGLLAAVQRGQQSAPATMKVSRERTYWIVAKSPPSLEPIAPHTPYTEGPVSG